MIKSLKMTRETFIHYHPMLTISKISRSDFETNGLIVQLETRHSSCKILANNKNNRIMEKEFTQQYEIEIIYQSEQINRILDVELTVI